MPSDAPPCANVTRKRGASRYAGPCRDCSPTYAHAANSCPEISFLILWSTMHA
ncbi:hypothetical protein BDY21DRAFT_73316 [Lineolata rhizophorae]|uniref:Uncharacterized protein n=1 Tax=Lineolata rhizophorae TaxID=578093 RepID=A0A6A6NUA3_9PEZI|nr:hypothetical protein BDY21DRAFT_73316 [Lineolata rhizophorae]